MHGMSKKGKNMRRIRNTFLALAVLFCMALPAETLHAETYYYTVTVLDTNDVTLMEIKVPEGSNLLAVLDQHPEYIDTITWGNTSWLPVFYVMDNGLKPYNTTSEVRNDMTVWAETVTRLESIPLRLTWPKAGEQAGIPTLSPAGNNPKYIASSYRWLASENAGVPYTGKFVEGQTYYLEMYLYPMEGYGFNTYGNRMKITVNGDLAKYKRETFPSDGVRAVYAVKIDDKIEAFVRRLYNMCLFREPDPSGFKTWSTKLKNKTATAAQTASGFLNSTEFKNRNFNDEDYVEICYLVLMNRAYDAGGKKTWMEALENGMSRSYVMKGFFGSTEFHKLCGQYGITPGTITLSEARDQNYGITSFIARCYTKALERKFDVPGLNNWCKKILNASNRKQTAIDTASTGFFHSPEFLNKHHSNEKYVTILYRTFLGREPDTGGYNNWLNKLKNGTSRDKVLEGFAYSPEFAKLMKTYGIPIRNDLQGGIYEENCKESSGTFDCHVGTAVSA